MITKFSVNLIKGKQKLRSTCHTRGFHVADVAANLCSRGQIDAAAGFERLPRSHLEPCVLLRSFGAQLFLQTHQELGAGGHGVGFDWPSLPVTVRLLPLLAGCWWPCP